MEIDTDVDFQRRVWTAQRLGWLVIAAVIVAALLGLFGTGPLSRASSQGSGLRLEYERFGRSEQPMRLRFLLPQSALDAEISVARAYVKSFRIESITPEPKEVEAAGPFFVYRFTGPGPLAARVRPFGGSSGNLAGRQRHFRQFIYP